MRRVDRAQGTLDDQCSPEQALFGTASDVLIAELTWADLVALRLPLNSSGAPRQVHGSPTKLILTKWNVQYTVPAIQCDQFVRGQVDKDGNYHVVVRKPETTKLADGRSQAPHMNIVLFVHPGMGRMQTRLYFPMKQRPMRKTRCLRPCRKRYAQL